jgi:hypothetical protein
LTLKMEVTCSSETLVDFQQTTQHYIPEDRILHNEILLNEYALSSAHCCYIDVLLCVWSILKGSDDGILCPVLLDFWALSVVSYFEQSMFQELEVWENTYSVVAIKNCWSESLDDLSQSFSPEARTDPVSGTLCFAWNTKWWIESINPLMLTCIWCLVSLDNSVKVSETDDKI